MWKPSFVLPRPSDGIETQELLKKVRGILNRLTPQKFAILVEQVKSLDINTEDKLKGVTDLVFEHAIHDFNFNYPYANMCWQLAMLRVPKNENPEEDVSFRNLILKKCQKEFEQERKEEVICRERLQAIEAAANPAQKKELQLKFEAEAKEMRYRQLGNIKFIGELFKLGMMIEPIVHECIKKFLCQGDEQSLECLCKLLKTTGKMLEQMGDTPKLPTRALMEQYFDQMQKIVDLRATSSRIRFMLQDVIDLKKNNWIPRWEENIPKTIDQIHKEAEEEARKHQNVTHPKRKHDKKRKKKGCNLGASEASCTPASKSEGICSVDPSTLKAAEVHPNMEALANRAASLNLDLKGPKDSEEGTKKTLLVDECFHGVDFKEMEKEK